MAGEIHKSKVGTYHPAPEPECKCEIVGRDGKGGPLPACKVMNFRYYGGKCAKDDYVAWTIHDSRGYLDGGHPCDGCGKCDCEDCPVTRSPICNCGCPGGTDAGYHPAPEDNTGECLGLSFSFVCLDGGENLCESCAEKAGITIVECDCK